MPKLKNSFARALKYAEIQLAVALKQRTAAQAKLVELDAEIPRLMQIIASLSGKGVPSGTDSTGFSNTRNSAVTGEHRAETSAAPPANMTPEELAKWYVERNLDGMGSIPHPTEDELLPEPEGEPLTEKD